MLWYRPAFSWQDKHMLSFLSIYLQTITKCGNTHPPPPPHTHKNSITFLPQLTEDFLWSNYSAERVWPDVEKVKLHSNSHITFRSYSWPQFCVSQTQEVHEWSVWSINSKTGIKNYYNHIFTNLATKQETYDIRKYKNPKEAYFSNMSALGKCFLCPKVTYPIYFI